MVTAYYASVCDYCFHDIDSGDSVEYTEDFGWIHTECWEEDQDAGDPFACGD